MIEARIVLDSINPAGNRLTTWLLTYPRMIHAEFMTHRVFSRNAASSRAIPIAKMIEAVQTGPAWPELWGSNKPGMQAGDPLDAEAQRHCLAELNDLREWAIQVVAKVESLGLHKQNANRYIEPWGHITVLATATDHSNFFKLRAHPAAQPEFQVLAYRMLNAYLRSSPQALDWGDWHLPGIDPDAADMYSTAEKLKIAVAQAARASYSAFDEGIEADKAFALHDRLRDAGHWSPFEHAAQAISDLFPDKMHKAFRSYPWSNFDWPGMGGPSQWGQYRKVFDTECTRRLDKAALGAILNSRPEWVKV